MEMMTFKCVCVARQWIPHYSETDSFPQTAPSQHLSPPDLVTWTPEAVLLLITLQHCTRFDPATLLHKPDKEEPHSCEAVYSACVDSLV